MTFETSPYATPTPANGVSERAAGDLPEPDTVIAGVVRSGVDPVSGAYVRLLDASGEFAAEVVTSATGRFRLFAAPGTWTLLALSGRGNGDATITVDSGVNEVVVVVE